MQIKVFVSGPFEVNTYLVYNDQNHEAFLVDPGLDQTAVIRFIEEEKIQLKWLVNTHGHMDHIQGNEIIVNRYNIPVYIGHEDSGMLSDPALNLSAFLDRPVLSPTADVQLYDGDKLQISGTEISVIHTPGHTPGSISLLWENNLISGDVIFYRSIGRTDFPNSNYNTLIKTIMDKILVLPDDTKIFPGHGPDTTIANERKMNPFLSEYV